MVDSANNIILFFIASLALASLTSCPSSTDPTLIDNGGDYLPLEKGKYWTYRVEKDVYTTVKDTSLSWYIKDHILDVEIKDDGFPVYTLNRYRSGSQTGPWEVEMAWTYKITDKQAIMLQNNTHTVNLVFPTRLNQTWDGNAINTQPEDLYEISEYDVEYQNSLGQTFPSTLLVNQEDNGDHIVQLIQRSERYARDVGMIEKNDINLVFCQLDECRGLQDPDYGHELKYLLIDFGAE